MVGSRMTAENFIAICTVPRYHVYRCRTGPDGYRYRQFKEAFLQFFDSWFEFLSFPGFIALNGEIDLGTILTS